MTRTIVGILILISSYLAHGQWSPGIGLDLGYNLPLYTRSPETTTLSPSISALLKYESDGRYGLMEKLYNYPTFQLSLSLQGLGNPKVMGNAMNLLPELLFSIGENERSKWLLGGGLGFGWAFKPFDKVTNPENQALGSHGNIYAKLHIDYHIRLSAHYSMSTVLSLQHYSNSFFSFPNLGLNMPAIGVVFYSDRFRESVKKIDNETLEAYDSDRKERSKWRPTIRLIHGITERSYDGPHYAVYGLGLGIWKRTTPIRGYVLGAEYLFDESSYTFLTHVRGRTSHKEFREASRLLVFGGHEFYMGYLGFVTELGIYLSEQYNRQSVISAKIGLNFYPINNFKNSKHLLSIGAYIRAYFLRADFFELALNYRI